MLNALDTAMILHRMIAYWLIIVAVGAVVFFLIRAWRQRGRENRSHRQRPRR